MNTFLGWRLTQTNQENAYIPWQERMLTEPPDGRWQRRPVQLANDQREAGRTGYATPNATACSSTHVAFSCPHRGTALPTVSPVRIPLPPNAAQSSTCATPRSSPTAVPPHVVVGFARHGEESCSAASRGVERGGGEEEREPGGSRAHSTILVAGPRPAWSAGRGRRAGEGPPPGLRRHHQPARRPQGRREAERRPRSRGARRASSRRLRFQAPPPASSYYTGSRPWPPDLDLDAGK
jgi:hypothetical protein